MNGAILISSPSNQTIKDLVRLKERKGERADRSFLVEGFREISRALASGFALEDFYFCSAEIQAEGRDLLERRVAGARYAELSRDAFARVATRDGADGLLAVFKSRAATFETIKSRAGSEPLFVVAVEDIEKPGNLGAVLRSADGAGVHGVVSLGRTVDPWNQNVIRSSLGGVFSVPVVQCDSADFFDWCQSNGVRVVAAALSDRGTTIYKSHLCDAVAIVLGSEARGLSPLALSRASEIAMIPMLGRCDSLNISVAAGVFMYEALRQRGL